MSGRRAIVIVGRKWTAKVFDDGRRTAHEESFYRLVPWAAPELVGRFGSTLIMETLAPARDLVGEPPVAELRALLERLHAAGVYHRDVSLPNVVLHPVRGPLLVDWELATRGRGRASYDLEGPSRSGIAVPPEHRTQGAQWWGAGKRDSMGAVWGERARSAS